MRRKDGIYHLIFDYPYPDEIGVLEYNGDIVGYFLSDRIIIFKKVDFQALLHILKDYALNYESSSTRFIRGRGLRDLIIAVGDTGYNEIVKHIVRALRGDIKSLNLLTAFAEGDNEKREYETNALQVVLCLLLKNRENQEQLEREFTSLKKEITKFMKKI